MKDNIALLSVIIGCLIGIWAVLEYMPLEQVEDARHTHETIKYKMRGGRVFVDVLCIDTMQLVDSTQQPVDSTHHNVPMFLEGVVNDFLYEYEKPEL